MRVNSFFLFTGVLLCWGCTGGNSNTTRMRETISEIPTQVMTQMQIDTFDEGGELAWELRAERAYGYPDKNLVDGEKINLQLYQKGKKSTDIQANQGRISTASVDQTPKSVTPSTQTASFLSPGDMYLSGDVVVVSSDGSKMYTDWLHFKKKDEMIHSTAPVKIVRDDSITTGVGIDATSTLSSVKIYDQTIVLKNKKRRK